MFIRKIPRKGFTMKYSSEELHHFRACMHRRIVFCFFFLFFSFYFAAGPLRTCNAKSDFSLELEVVSTLVIHAPQFLPSISRPCKIAMLIINVAQLREVAKETNKVDISAVIMQE